MGNPEREETLNKIKKGERGDGVPHMMISVIVI